MAQEKPDLEKIRKSASLGAVEQPRVEQWVNQQLDKLFNSKSPMKDGSLVFAELTRDFKASDATDGFKTAMAELVSKGFTARYKAPATGESQANPIPAVYALLVLKTYAQPIAVPCFMAGLNDPTSGVRFVASEGLLRTKISSENFQKLFPDVVRIATDEPNPVVLRRLYGVMTLNGGVGVAESVSALLKVLKARLDRIERTGEFPTVADAEAVKWLVSQLGNINNEQAKKDLAHTAGRLLADAIHVYVTQDLGEDVAHRLERVVIMAEEGLKALVKPADGAAPDVVGVMSAPAEDEQAKELRKANLRAECDKWIGSDQVSGLLNGAPFNLEKGLGIQRPAPSASGEGTSSGN